MQRVTRIFIACSLLMLLVTGLMAQRNARIVLQNDPSSGAPTINVKWYSQEFIYPEGCHVYRSEEGSGWHRLTTSPLKQWKEMPVVYFQKDSNLQMFTEVLKSIKAEQLNGFLLLQLMTESFLNADFSRFAGIQYDDSAIIPGKKYRYRVTYLTNNTELELAVSKPIVAGTFVPHDSLTGFFAEPAKRQTLIGWDAMDTSFFGVNLYRMVDNEPEIRLNQNPIALSMRKDSTGKLSYPKIKFVDDSVHENHAYTYRLAGIDFFGNETNLTLARKVWIRDMDPPSAPFDVQKKIQKLNVWLTWKNTEERDLTGFNIYRSTDDKTGFLKINAAILSPATLFYTDEVSGTGGYYYYISAVDSTGNEGNSDKVFADVADLFPPLPPEGLKAEADTGIIRLSWLPNTEKDLDGYMVYRTIDTDNSARYTLMNANAIKETFFADTLPKNIKNRMVYRIAAVDTSFNRSDYSKCVSARMPDVLPPAQPFIRNVGERDHILAVEWIPNVEPDLMGYEVLRTTNLLNHPFEKVNEGLLSGRVTRFTDRTVEPDTIYYYSLVAVDSSGNRSVQSHWFSGSVAANPAEVSSSVIVSFKAVSRKDNIYLQWKTDNGDDFIGYSLYSETAGNVNRLTEIVTGNKYTDPSAATDTRYQLRLYHSSGVVVKSAWISANK